MIPGNGLHSCDSDSPMTRASKVFQGNICIWAIDALRVSFLESLGTFGSMMILAMDSDPTDALLGIVD